MWDAFGEFFPQFPVTPVQKMGEAGVIRSYENSARVSKPSPLY